MTKKRIFMLIAGALAALAMLTLGIREFTNMLYSAYNNEDLLSAVDWVTVFYWFNVLFITVVYGVFATFCFLNIGAKADKIFCSLAFAALLLLDIYEVALQIVDGIDPSFAGLLVLLSVTVKLVPVAFVALVYILSVAGKLFSKRPIMIIAGVMAILCIVAVLLSDTLSMVGLLGNEAGITDIITQVLHFIRKGGMLLAVFFVNLSGFVKAEDDNWEQVLIDQHPDYFEEEVPIAPKQEPLDKPYI